MFFGRDKWDPILIITQIIALQCIYYTMLGIMLFISSIITDTWFEMDLFFEYTTMDFTTSIGIAIIISLITASIIEAIVIRMLIERAKKCLDFTFTLHFIQFVIVLIYSSFPVTFTWWIVTLISLGIMTLLSEYLCMKYEMTDIKLNTSNIYKI
eukprot:TRINITY_DN6385_c1_g1_i1.p1 TRINITY_DN6385_c1_g1~~TRINITY_DN6385_c1_g1_i1.p1  ORF type:complete len:154 (+),score=6.78 TRINITY_DN6385_c1_g1_i1:205-666(+)